MSRCTVAATGGLPISRPVPLLVQPGSTQHLLLISDIHLGASNCDLGLLQRDLKRAGFLGARILIGGDLLDLIMPQDKKRYRPARVHERIRGRNDAVNAAVEWAVELLRPYAHLIDGIGVGNHESKVEDLHGVDPIRAVVKGLNPGICYLGYTGFIEYEIRARSGARNVANATKQKRTGRYVIWYTHGSGRASSPARSLTSLQARAAVFDADLYWQGHTHGRLTACDTKIKCPKHGRAISYRDVRYLITGSYLNTYGGQSQEEWDKYGRLSNYAADEAMPLHGRGGAWVTLHFDQKCFLNIVEVSL